MQGRERLDKIIIQITLGVRGFNSGSRRGHFESQKCDTIVI
jgi:hypothetical protein